MCPINICTTKEMPSKVFKVYFRTLKKVIRNYSSVRLSSERLKIARSGDDIKQKSLLIVSGNVN